MNLAANQNYAAMYQLNGGGGAAVRRGENDTSNAIKLPYNNPYAHLASEPGNERYARGTSALWRNRGEIKKSYPRLATSTSTPTGIEH
jgi:hypothetical protein